MAPEPAALPAAPPAERRLALQLFALVWLSCAWFGSWEWNANNATRLFAAISLAEDRSAAIDPYAGLTIDKARFGDHVYLDKPPGMSLLATPIVWTANAISGERAGRLAKRIDDPMLGRFLKSRMRLTTALVVAPLVALATMLLFRLTTSWTGNAAAGVFAALAFGIGSPVWGWATTLFGHAPVAALYVIALYAVERAAATARLRWMSGAGLALGLAVLIEYQAVLAGGVIAVWALWRTRALARARPWALLVGLIAGGAPAAAALAGYNLLAFGTPFRIAYAGVSGFDGMKDGFYGLTWPKPHVLLELYFAPRRGLAWVAPVLALGPFALIAMVRSRNTRPFGLLAAAGASTVLLLNAAYVYWEGGNATGPRHAIPAIGFLAIAMAFRWAAQPRERPPLAVLLAVSIAINLMIASADIFAPEDIRYPLWSWIITGRFAAGQLKTWPSEWLGMSSWTGLALYLLLAVPLLIAIVRQARRIDELPPSH